MSLSPDQALTQDDRISWRTKFFYSLGGQLDLIFNQLAIGGLLLPIFNLGFGLSPTSIGLVIMGFRLWDALVDPIVGNMSDNARTRWGRRRPFIVGGAMATGLLLPLLWHVDKSHGEMGVALHLLIVGILLNTAYSVWSMPYASLGMELTSNYDERTRLSAWCSFVGIPFGLLGAWNFTLVSGPWFANPITGQPDLVRGIQTVSLIQGAAMIALGVLPGFFVRERLYQLEVVKQRKESLWTSLRTTFSTAPLWPLIGVAFFNLLGIGSISTLGQYINIYFINDGKLYNASLIDGWKTTAMVVTGLAAIPFWTWFCERTDKKTALYLVLIGTMIGHGLSYFCIRHDLPYLQIIPGVFYAGISNSIWLIVPSMRMDVADYDELRTGKRREGSLSSVFSCCIKMSLTLSLGLGGWILDLTGFKAHTHAQAPEVLSRMFWTYLSLPMFFWALSIACLWFFRLDRSAMRAIRRRLQLRVERAA